MDTSVSTAAKTSAAKQEVKMVGRKEAYSYALTDFGQQLIWGTIGAYLVFFYTDVYGLAASSLTVLFLVTRFWDAANDLGMGIIADRYPGGKNGKYTPFIKWGVFPLAVIIFLLFTTPDFSNNGKLIWAYGTYMVATLAFTVVNVPYNALLPSMTSNYQERTSLTAKRMTFMMIAAILLNTLTRPLFISLGRGNNALGMQLTILIYLVIAVPLILNGAIQSKERINVEKPKNKIPFKQAKKAFTLPWFIIVIINFCMWVGQTLRMSAAIYYLTYVFKKPEMVSLFAPVAMVCILPSIMITPKIAKAVKSKRLVIIIGSIISIAGSSTIFIAGNNVPFLLAGAVLAGIGFGPQISLTYSMMADCIDYGEWKSGVRAQALLGAGGTFGTKLGTAIGGVALTICLTVGGYVANQAQTPAAIAAITGAFIFIPIAMLVLTIIVLLFYKLDGAFYYKVKQELEERRQAAIAKE